MLNLLTILSVSLLLNNGWTFSLGNASDAQADFTHGTEYFSYVCKAKCTNQSTSPAMPSFDDSAWQKVNLPHDWAVDLPFSGEASHSHGYKCIGWKYPQNSVGWYRRHLDVPENCKGKRVYLVFDGIYRDSQVFFNGFFLGGRKDGYLQQTYELTDYLLPGEDNVITVRCDATLEEGWFYEGAGIYRNVHLIVAPEKGFLPGCIKTQQSFKDGAYTLTVETATTDGIAARHELLDAGGNLVYRFSESAQITDAHEWSVDDPYLYTLRSIAQEDTVLTRIGLRRMEFTSDNGLLLNGMKLVMKGCNLHQDHAGVGSGIPDELWRYRIAQLKKYGFNTIRCSHNPASPAMLDLCDEMGMLVIDENREFGTNPQQLDHLRDMILRDLNHPSVTIWSIGNEEWALEWDPRGEVIARKMCDYAHSIDPSRPVTYGNSGGKTLVRGLDVFGYNYIVQNPVLEYRADFPHKTAIGTEETTRAGTRGMYRTVPEEGWMQPLNRRDTAGVVNAIERGWKFYRQNEWACGLCYWTGIDYRGEPNPMAWPATGSQFGILDYCAYPKDEAWYLKSWWMPEEPVLHICGEADGQVWVYSNLQEVELLYKGKSLGRQKMPQDGHLVWDVKPSASPDDPATCGYEYGSFTAKGIFQSPDGKRQKMSDIWPCKPRGTVCTLSKDTLMPDGQDVVVVDVDSPETTLAVSAVNAQILGWGNGNPGFKETERPQNGKDSINVKPFSGKCQILVRSIENASGSAEITLGGGTTIKIDYAL